MAVPWTLVVKAAVSQASAYQQGRIARAEAFLDGKIADRNALTLEQDATAFEEKARFDQIRQTETGLILMGRLRAGLGASGARLDVGAPIRVLSDQAEELELDNLLIGRAGAVGAAKLRDRASFSRFQAKIFRIRGRNAYKAGFLPTGETTQAGGAILEGKFEGGGSGVGETAGRDRTVKSLGAVGTIRGRRPKLKRAFAGTNVSSASPFGTISA